MAERAAGPPATHPTRPRTRRFPVLRPDGTIFRSYRAQNPDASWKLLCVNGPEVRRLRIYLDIGSQSDLAELLSTTEYGITQPEIVDLEHGGSFVNALYLHRLAAALECDVEDLIDNPAAPTYSQSVPEEDAAEDVVEEGT